MRDLRNLTEYLGQIYVTVDVPSEKHAAVVEGLEDVASEAEEFGMELDDLSWETIWFPDMLVLVLFTDDTPAPIINRMQSMFAELDLPWRAVPAADYPPPSEAPTSGLEILALGSSSAPMALEASMASILPAPVRVLARAMGFETETRLGGSDSVFYSNDPQLHPMITWWDSVGPVGGTALVAPQLVAVFVAERALDSRDVPEFFSSFAGSLATATYVGSDGAIDTLRYFPTSCGQFGEGWKWHQSPPAPGRFPLEIRRS